MNEAAFETRRTGVEPRFPPASSQNRRNSPRIGRAATSAWTGRYPAKPTIAASFRLLLAACMLAVAAAGGALAQSAEDLSYLTPMPDNMKSLDSYGNVCLHKLDRFAQQLPSASTVQFEQSVTVHNRCLKQVFVELCYEGRKRCKQARIPAMSKAVVVLGIDRINHFTFKYQEMKSPF